MNVTLVNKSQWSDESLQSIVDFLAPCYGEMGLPVRLTIKSKRGMGTWGKAFFPRSSDRRTIKKGEYSAVVYIGTIDRNNIDRSMGGQYPRTRIYKKRAGGYTATSLVDEVVHTIAHELRHIEQFEQCRLALGITDVNAGTRNPVTGRVQFFGNRFRAWEHSKASGFKYGSCEYDAEIVAHGLLGAYRTCLEKNLLGRAA